MGKHPLMPRWTASRGAQAAGEWHIPIAKGLGSWYLQSATKVMGVRCGEKFSSEGEWVTVELVLLSSLYMC